MRCLLCEGPDGVGKTQISKALSAYYNIPYFKVSTEKENWMKDAFRHSIPFDVLLPEFVRQTGVEFVSDRCYISEIVYADVFNRKTDSGLLWEVDREWGRMNAVVVMCMRRDYSSVDDDLVERSQLEYLHDRYVKFCAHTKCHVIKLYVDDYSDDIDRQLPVLTEQIDLIWQLGSDSSVNVKVELS